MNGFEVVINLAVLCFRAILLGEAAMKHKNSEGRWGEDPNSAKDTHLSPS